MRENGESVAMAGESGNKESKFVNAIGAQIREEPEGWAVRAR